MAALMKNKSFIRSSEGAVPSYDGFDFAAGTGIKTFYPIMVFSGASTATGVLTTEVMHGNSNTGLHSISGAGYLSFGTASALASGAMLQNFDAVFLRPVTIQGDIYCTIPWVHLQGGVGNSTYGQVIISKVVDGVAEEVNRSAVFGYADGATTAYHLTNELIKVPRFSIKIGDSLRVGLSGTTDIAAGNGKGIFGIDPANKLTFVEEDAQIVSFPITSTTELQIPFVIDT